MSAPTFPAAAGGPFHLSAASVLHGFLDAWMARYGIAYLYYYCLAVLLLLAGLRFGLLAQERPRRHGPGLLLQIPACALLALVPAELWRRTLWFSPVMLALGPLLLLLLWLFSGFDGSRTIPAVAAYLAAAVLWLWASEVLTLPRLLFHLPWQIEFTLSLLLHGCAISLGLLAARRHRVWLQARLSFPRAWSWYFAVLLFFTVIWYIYLSWVLDTSGFYFWLGQFTRFISASPGAHRTLALVGSLVLLCLMLLALFTVSRVSRLGKVDAEASLIMARNQALMESYLGVQRYYHDVKHHLEVISYLVGKEDVHGIDQYLRQLERQRRGIFQSVNSGNIYVDAVLNSKLLEAEQRDIHTDVEIAYPTDSKIAPVDICTILGNLLDNALEHCGGDQDGSIRIQVGMAFRNRFLILKVGNTVAENPLESNPSLKTSKAESALHGFGLQSVRAALRAYNGEISFHCHQGFFEVHITMNC